MKDIVRARRQLTKTLKGFEVEAKAVYKKIVEPRWNERPSRNRMPEILHSCMMWCFARIDLLSSYWKGSTKDQSKRMVDFMQQYMGPGRLECSRAVKLWRHTMMHTGAPRLLTDKKAGISLAYLLHWGEQLSQSEHFTVTGAGSTQINMALFYLIDDLKKAQRKYLADLLSRPDLQDNYRKAETEMSNADLRVY